MAVEEQTQYDQTVTLHGTTPLRVGQELAVPDRLISKLGFWLSKLASPTGNITFTIRAENDDEALASKVLADASTLTTEAAYYEVTFDAPVQINETVRMCVEYGGGDTNNRVYAWEINADVKASEFMVFYYSAVWYDSAATDLAYIYTYEGDEIAGNAGVAAALVAANMI